MASTSALASPLLSGYTELPGLRVGPAGGVLTSLKLFDFTITTSTFTTGSTAFYEARYPISGLTTNDIPIALTPSTGVLPLGIVGMRPATSTAGGLNVTWAGNSTTVTQGLITANVSATLLTVSYYNQTPSTTT